LEANRELVFAAPSEFKAHHEARITTKAGETAEGERLMPKEEVIATNMKLKTAKAAHVEATKALKDKHAKTVNALKEGTAKKVAAAEAKGKKKIDSVLTTVDKMDALAVEIIGLTDGTSKLKPEQIAAKVNALAGKIRKLADKHLA
jgi:cation transport regulator ChaB